MNSNCQAHRVAPPGVACDITPTTRVHHDKFRIVSVCDRGGNAGAGFHAAEHGRNGCRALELPRQTERAARVLPVGVHLDVHRGAVRNRKSTRLNSSHSQISYAVFCLKKKKRRFTTPFISLSRTFEKIKKIRKLYG